MKIKSQRINKKKAVVLFSGGLDSTTVLYFAQSKGYETFCLTFDYGQRHKKEIKRAEEIARKCRSLWQVIKFSLPWKGSSLIDTNQVIPENRDIDSGIPSTYVPCRNIIFLSFAASFAESIGAQTIFIGANQIDYSGYPDCNDEFLKAFENALRKGTKFCIAGKKMFIAAPLIHKNKAQIIKLGIKLKVPFALTWSCYQGGSEPCGVCDSCRLRAKGFAQAKVKEPKKKINNA
ncbi:MAG: 7-cyano-7-deazaguanine synthase QueC [Candidatus Omnitrophota bacterium]|nr:MAG: 7-cyano-7-deazaguanine synthase QueC [Candidatus Omnitrophota bacterium]